jgi:hypothetical protein
VEHILWLAETTSIERLSWKPKARGQYLAVIEMLTPVPSVKQFVTLGKFYRKLTVLVNRRGIT